MVDKKENLILSVSSENEAKIVVNKSIFIGIIRIGKKCLNLKKKL